MKQKQKPTQRQSIFPDRPPIKADLPEETFIFRPIIPARIPSASSRVVRCHPDKDAPR
jgi:hypothetical protein